METREISQAIFDQNIISGNYVNESAVGIGNKHYFNEEIHNRMSPTSTEKENIADNTHKIKICIEIAFLVSNSYICICMEAKQKGDLHCGCCSLSIDGS